MSNQSHIFQDYSPEGVVKTARLTFEEYSIASQHFVSNRDVLSTLLVLGRPLQCVQKSLESIIISGDDAIHLRLDNIIIGDPAQQITLLTSLSTDLQTIYSCLQGARNGTSLSKPYADLYMRSLDQYVELLENAQKGSMECVIFFLVGI
jgi:hypothetical protein